MRRGVSAFDSLNTKQWQTVLMAMQKRHCFAGEVVVAQVSAFATAKVASLGLCLCYVPGVCMHRMLTVHHSVSLSSSCFTGFSDATAFKLYSDTL